MKKYLLILCIGLLGVSYSKSASNCENKLLVKLLQDLLDSSNLVRPWTRHILEVVNDLSNDESTVLETISQNDEIINSKLDDLDECCDANGSQLDVIESLVENIEVSGSDELILSQLDIIEECCASSSDVLGELTDIGSCLDSAIDVPDDINNLTLTVIALLKTILLDLRGCNIP